MVAGKNRMFRTAGGKIITAQDALKAGIISELPTTAEQAREMAQGLSGEDRDKLFGESAKRIGYKVNPDTVRVEKVTPSKGDYPKYSPGSKPYHAAKEAAVYSFNDIDAIQGKGKASSNLTNAIQDAGGTVNPVLVTGDPLNGFKPIDPHSAKILASAQQAKGRDDSFELVRTVAIKPGQEALAKRQLELLGNVQAKGIASRQNQKTGGLNERIKATFVDIDSVSSPKSTSFNKREIEELAHNFLLTGGPLRPVIIEQTGFEQYKVIGNEKALAAARRAKEIEPYFELTRSIIVTPENKSAVMAQL